MTAQRLQTAARPVDDVAQMHRQAELLLRTGRHDAAEALLTRVLALAPGRHAARHALALLLHRTNRWPAAIAELDRLLATHAHDDDLLILKAAALTRLGEHDAAIRLHEAVLARAPDQPRLWLSLGHLYKTVGRSAECVAAYRRCIALAPGFGEAWWSLANLKRERFSDADRRAMTSALAGAGDAADRLHLEFALGKAAEDDGDWAASFAHYDRANRQRRTILRYDPAQTTALVEQARGLFTANFLDARATGGANAPDPIFVIGMPRAGSTLIERILAGHPDIEATGELRDLPAVSRQAAGGEFRPHQAGYYAALAELGAAERTRLGEDYLLRTRAQRRTGRRFFIDKNPNNWIYVGLIQLILPHAKIIDARRHPLACCFSNYTQHFARGQGFAYDLDDLGRYYRDYVALLAHFDAVRPGLVHRVHYEAVVADVAGETRRILEYLGLPFDPACPRFHERGGPVRTASAEQVRQPLYGDAIAHWRHYERWLGPLARALGPAIDDYPHAG